MKRPHNRIKKDVPIIFELEESGELSTDDVNAVAEFIAHIAYNNLKKAQDNVDKLIQTTLNEVEQNDKTTELS